MGNFGTRKIQIILMSLILLSGLLVLFVVESPTNLEWQSRTSFISYHTNQKEKLKPGTKITHSPCACLRNLSSTQVEKSTNSNIEWCSHESILRGPNQKIVAFSLFGNIDNSGKRYFAFIRDNAVAINKLLPGWIMRLHHNLEQGTAEHRLLCDVYCDNPWVDLCNINTLWRRLSKRKRKLFPDFRPVTGEKISNLNRRIWRFLPLLDPWSDIVLTRDIDALITNREIAALDQWLASNFTFHVMRDHQGHKAHILAGLFGVKVKQRRDLIEGLTRVLINFGQNQKYDTDQIILSKVFWPSVKHDVMAHDSYNCMENWNALPTYPFPTQRANGSFVSDNVEGHWIDPEKCPITCRPLNHQDWEYC